MRVGIGLPTRADARSPEGLLDWAQRADVGPFASPGVLDRVVFPGADAQAAAYIRTSYAFDPALAERRLRGIPTTSAAVRSVLGRQAAMGVDEFIPRPCAPDPSLIDRLGDIVAGPA